MSVWCSADRLATASSSAREHETAKRGRERRVQAPFPAPFQRLPIARLSSIEACVVSCSRLGAAASPSNHATCRSFARMPLAAVSSNTTSVSCTVSIVSTAVVRPPADSVVARRVAARNVGRRVSRFHRPHALPQPVHQRQVVRVTAKERLAQMDVGLDEPGKDVPAPRVDQRRSCRSPTRRSDCGDSAILHRHRPPSTMSKRSFIVRMTPAADRRDTPVSCVLCL